MTDGTPSQTNAFPAVPITPEVAASYRHCHEVTRASASSFYFGLKLTPEPKRSALYAVYGYMRSCDDLVDGGPPGPSGERVQERAARLAEFRQHTDAALDPAAALPPGRIWPAVRHVSQAFGLDRRLLHDMLDGQQMDLATRRYATFEDLYGYCYRVASVVGLVCLGVWGHDEDPGVYKLAEYRGVAFQLTNIVRDVAEDAGRGRVYIPQDELARFGVTDEQLSAVEPSRGLDRLLQYQIERARSYYEMSATLERHIHPDGQATSWTMTQVYRRLLEQIAKRPQSVLRRRVRLSPLQKLAIAVQGTLRSRAAKRARPGV